MTNIPAMPALFQFIDYLMESPDVADMAGEAAKLRSEDVPAFGYEVTRNVIVGTTGEIVPVTLRVIVGDDKGEDLTAHHFILPEDDDDGNGSAANVEITANLAS